MTNDLTALAADTMSEGEKEFWSKHYGPNLLNAWLAKEKAEAEGFTVVETTPTRLLIDLDGFRNAQMFLSGFQALADLLGDHTVAAWRSKDTGVHVQIQMEKEFEFPERLLLQMLLGSDPVRETLAAVMFADNERRDDDGALSMLFRPPGEDVTDGEMAHGLIYKLAMEETTDERD
jgi:hypothetical protein